MGFSERSRFMEQSTVKPKNAESVNVFKKIVKASMLRKHDTAEEAVIFVLFYCRIPFEIAEGAVFAALVS